MARSCSAEGRLMISDDEARKKTRAYAPATVANFAVGFDVLGVAIAPQDGSLWGDIVTVAPETESTEPLSLSVEGEFAGDLPNRSRSNLVYSVATRFLERLASEGLSAAPLRVHLEKRLPVGSGLGSSASSSVAALTALQHHFDRPFSPEQILEIAGWSEGQVSGSEHLDNVGPAYLGGMRLVAPGGRLVSLPWPEELHLVLLSPEFVIETRAAREVLPDRVELSRARAYWRNLAGFVAALYEGDLERICGCLKDDLIEGFRGSLLPGFSRVQEAARDGGALGCSFSGSGPAMFAVVPGVEVGDEVGSRMLAALNSHGIEGVVRVCKVDRRGSRVLPDPTEESEVGNVDESTRAFGDDGPAGDRES